MPDDLRWSWSNNNRDTVYNKHNVFESYWNHPHPCPPVRGKIVFHKIGPWCQRGWGLLLLYLIILVLNSSQNWPLGALYELVFVFLLHASISVLFLVWGFVCVCVCVCVCVTSLTVWLDNMILLGSSWNCPTLVSHLSWDLQFLLEKNGKWEQGLGTGEHTPLPGLLRAVRRVWDPELLPSLALLLQPPSEVTSVEHAAYRGEYLSQLASGTTSCCISF